MKHTSDILSKTAAARKDRSIPVRMKCSSPDDLKPSQIASRIHALSYRFLGIARDAWGTICDKADSIISAVASHKKTFASRDLHDACNSLGP